MYKRPLQHFFVLVLCGGSFITGCTPGKNTSVDAKATDTFIESFRTEPETLHPIRSTDLYATKIHFLTIDTLLQRDLDTHELKPHLATSFKWSKDGQFITFTLRKGVKFHDGKPLTAQDVAFSFKATTDPSYGGLHALPYFENIESVKVLDTHRVQFKIKNRYFGNLQALGTTLSIIPEHIYKDKKQGLNRSLTGSGAYILKTFDRGKSITLEQNPKWWGRSVKPTQYRIKKIMIRFIKDENDQLIRATSGGLDFLPNLSIEAFMKKTNKPPWGVDMIKKEIQSKRPSGYGYIGWNLKKPLFQDKKTRQALALLFDRNLINEKFYYGKKKLATGPWYSWSDYADPSVKPVPFDPKKARILLREAGWRDEDKNGVLEKTFNGKKREFKFTLLFPSKKVEKHLTIYKEELKKSGIDLSLRLMDWVAFLKLVNEKTFDAMTLGWSGGESIDFDPKQIWHSSSVEGSNYISYSNPQVDALIDKGRAELDKAKRIKIYKKIYRLIAEDYPYLFLFNDAFEMYAISKKVKILKDTYNYKIGRRYWQTVSPDSL